VITQVELDGFKTFQEFKLVLAPFQVIIGANGAGKSNLFDALRLLSRLAETDVVTAFQDPQGRGTPNEVFTLLPNGQPVERMRLAVEMLVEPRVRDSLGQEVDLIHMRLRYELEIARSMDELGLPTLSVTHESLAPISQTRDSWAKRYLVDRQTYGASWAIDPTESFISSEMADSKRLYLISYKDGDQPIRHLEATSAVRTTLGALKSIDFPHILAASQEMQSWRFLLNMDPDVLRQPTLMSTTRQIGPDGNGLAGVLARMQAEDPFLLTDISRDLANMVPGFIKVEVKPEELHRDYTILAHTADGRVFSSRVLSDGTLRLLTLITLVNDPDHHGVLCLEEPENGVHPFRLKHMAHLLHGLATDLSDPDQLAEPLRQVLINTHSPILVSELSKVSEGRPEIVFAYMVTHMPGGNRVTRMVPVTRDRQLQQDLEIAQPEEAYTLKQVLDYLDSADTGGAVAVLGQDSH
jgi:predicted ATPase